MTRRGFLVLASSAAVTPPVPGRLSVPIHRIFDGRSHPSAGNLRRFQSSIWPEAVREFRGGGIDLKVSEGPGEIRMSAADRPIFVGLRRRAINLVLTNHLPLYWDNSRALAGMSTIYEGTPVCAIALQYAHANQVALVSTNTCVHEILHALLEDLLRKPPKWYQYGGREFRVDWYATRLQMFHEGAAIRESGQAYLKRLQSAG